MANDPTIRAAAAFAEQAGTACAAIGRAANALAAFAEARVTPPDAQAVAEFLSSLPPPRAARASLLLRSVRALADPLSRAAITVLVHSTHPAVLPLAWLVLAAVERLYHGIAACETTL